VVGESAVANVGAGENTVPTRVPIQAGDRIGLFANSQFGALFCGEEPETEVPGNAIGFIPGNPAVGSTATVAETKVEELVPVAAGIEPDVDGDGFGDETQDKCPQSAAFQIECPQIALDEFALAGKGAITVLVISDRETNVSVSASTKSGKAAKRHALKGAAVTLKKVTKKVVPGKLSKFKLPFTKQLRSALAALPPGKSLKLHVTASAKNVIGQVSTVSKTVKLKGPAKR
jgi:hypothetical protein